MQCGGTAARSAGASIAATGNRPPIAAAARRMTAQSPTTKASAAAPVANNRAAISGPMPQASPMVMASGGEDGEAIRSLSPRAR